MKATVTESGTMFQVKLDDRVIALAKTKGRAELAANAVNAALLATYDEGHSDGYSDGHTDGYDEGYSDAEAAHDAD